MTKKQLTMTAVSSAIVAGAAWAALAFAQQPASAPRVETKVAQPQAQAASDADRALIEKGRYLAAAADCVACHTARGGKPFAGGLGIDSPIGRIYSTNITPDKQTGIGDYSFEDFDNAVRHGVAKNGSSLYPAMPYVS